MTRIPVRGSQFVLALCMFLLPLVGISSEAIDEKTIYVASDGNDSNSGTNATKPLRSLSRALAVYEAAKTDSPTQISIAPGNYDGEHLSLKSFHGPLVIEANDANHRPSFVGSGEGTWLRIDVAEGKMIDMTITGLEVKQYQSAISLGGDRDDPARWLGGVKITHNRFVAIGSQQEGQHPATAAIRLVNAQRNVIADNEFENIRNLTSCGGLHAVYIAHLSSENQVIGNQFVDGCGDTIKVRDASNANVIARNRFERQEGASLLLDSFCDKLSRGDCTKPDGECPSWDNVFEHNITDRLGGDNNKKIVAVRKYRSDLSGICPPPPVDGERIRESGTE